MPLGIRGLVEGRLDDDASFQEPFTLTPDHREKEIVIRLWEHRTSGTYGFAKSELPVETGFAPLPAPRLGSPSARLFVETNSFYEWMRPPYLLHLAWLFVDDRGEVWRAERVWPREDIEHAPEPEYRQLGRVDTAVLERMKSLAGDAATGQLESVCAGCVDCGFLRIAIYGGAGAGPEGVTIAKGESDCDMSTAPAAKKIAAWMVALRKQVLPLKDPPAIPNPDTRP